MVTKQEQLEFAAKHIEKWKSGYDYAVVERDADGYLYVRWPSVCTRGITKKEWLREREKMSSESEVDASWHERGELPPVGCECEIRRNCWREFQRITVVAITKEYVIVEDDSVVAREQHYHLSDMTFRPLRTEREKAIEEMLLAIDHIKIEEMLLAIDHIKEGNFETFIGALYDAGYRKVKP